MDTTIQPEQHPTTNTTNQSTHSNSEAVAMEDTADMALQPPYTSNGAPLNITTAKTIAQNYVTSTNNPDLTVKQVEEYQANYYVQVTEKSTGNGAFELLINKYTGSIYPEMGPNMMWNTKYGMMRGGILGGLFGTPTTTMTVTTTQATTNAQQFLTSNTTRNHNRRCHHILRLLHNRSPQRNNTLRHAQR